MTRGKDYSSDSDDGVAWPPDFHVDFVAQAHEIYDVFIAATVSGDQSGQAEALGFYPAGDSYFMGGIDVTVPWVAAELRV